MIFNDGGSALPEEKKISALAANDDMVTLSWSKPIDGTNWNTGSKAFKFRRTFRLFGYNAPDQLYAVEHLEHGARWHIVDAHFNRFQEPRRHEAQPRQPLFRPRRRQ